MLRKIYISGAHSVGKSLLWETLKKELYLKDTKLIFCAETGREIATEQGHTNVNLENPEQLKKFLIACTDKYIKREDTLQDTEGNNNALAIYDRGVVDAVVYIGGLFGQAAGEELLGKPEIMKNLSCHCDQSVLVFIIKPFKKFFEYDGLRPENMDYTDVLKLDGSMRETMTKFQIPFVEIEMEDLQERVEFVAKEAIKRWPDLKRGRATPM